MNYIQQNYKVPAEIGRRVRSTGEGTPKEGVITECSGQYIYIHFDGDKKPRGPYHPTSEIEYLGMGKVPKMTRSQERYQRYRQSDGVFGNFANFLGYEKDERDARKCGFGDVSSYLAWLRTL